MIHYILQTLAFQLLFLVVYDLFLKKETFFNYNRLYLIFSPVLSFILPLIKINALTQQIPSEFYVQLPTVLLGDISTVSGESMTTTIASESFSIFQIVPFLWLAGVLVSVALFGYKAIKIFRLKQFATLKTRNGISFYEIPNSDTAFTFVKTIFLGAALSETQQKSILLHEQVHVKENHFADLLFFEMLRIVCWFNPLVYIFQQRVSVLQEYKADAVVMKQQSKQEYYHNLLSQVFSVDHISFINTFFNHSLLKKRIVMLQKSKSKRIFQLKYLLLVPVVFGMLLYSACTNDSASVEEFDLEQFTYSIKLGEEMSPETQEIHDNYENFLKENNEEYVAWVSIQDKTLTYTVHHKKEDVPDDYSRNLKMKFPNGSYYFAHMQLREMAETHSYFDPKKNIATGIQVQEVIDTEGLTIDVPFAVLEKSPIFPGCENMYGEQLKKCFTKEISTFVSENFNTKLADNLELSGRQRISIIFRISKSGEIENVQARAAHPSLEDEAKRVISLLPKMEPGEAKGEKVNVLYNLPILFEIEE